MEDMISLARAAPPGKLFMVLEREGVPAAAMTFAALIRRAECYAASFRRLGLRPETPAVIMMNSDPDLPPAFLGAAMAGLVPAVFAPGTPRQVPGIFWRNQEEVLRDTGASVVVAGDHDAAELARHVPSLAAAVLTPSAVPDAAWDPPRAPDPASPAFLQFSSGTTGKRKGVVLTHAAVTASVRSLGDALRISPGDVIASWLPRYHDMGLVGCMLLPMLLGLTVVQLDPFEWTARPSLLLDAIRRHRATLCWMPNFAFHHLARRVPASERHDLSSMRAFIDCSEPCRPETLKLFGDRFADEGVRPGMLQVSYALAENVFAATQTDVSAPPPVIHVQAAAFAAGEAREAGREGEPSLSFVSSGRPVPGTRIEIRGEAGARLAEGRVGEIAVSSSCLFTGYHGRPTPPGVLAQGWFLTGDLGFVFNGELYVCGRKDDMLVINGRNIYAHDIEHAVNRDTPIKPGRCVAIGPFNPRSGSQSLVLVAETAEQDDAARKEIARAIRVLIQSLFGILPYDVVIKDVGWLVKTTSGKISREANTRQYLLEQPLS